ncbi:MAG: hypothetical protein L0Z48_06025, partial [candidate division Zixibacteria bacterium]|nr:hypothetical protein [candidate division Zixibacteria bacterium]
EAKEILKSAKDNFKVLDEFRKSNEDSVVQNANYEVGEFKTNSLTAEEDKEQGQDFAASWGTTSLAPDFKSAAEPISTANAVATAQVEENPVKPLPESKISIS